MNQTWSSNHTFFKKELLWAVFSFTFQRQACETKRFFYDYKWAVFFMFGFVPQSFCHPDSLLLQTTLLSQWLFGVVGRAAVSRDTHAKESVGPSYMDAFQPMTAPGGMRVPV